ncbi:hypothetical protein FRC10_009999, partial [Ceratobasidium sp. 414]
MQSPVNEKSDDLETCTGGACDVLQAEGSGLKVPEEEFGKNSKFVQKLKTWGVESRG